MARIGRHLKAEIDKYIEQVVETRLNYNQSAMTYAASGDDSPPLENDRIVLVQVDGTGRFVAAGVLTVSQGAKPGEKILFSRDEDGEVQAALRLLNDGKIEMVAPDAFSIESEKKLSLKTEDEFSLESAKKLAAKTDDAMELEAKNKMSLKGSEVAIEGQTKAEIKAAMVSVTGGNMQVNGTAAPSGSGPFCAIPVCPFSGAPHVGNMVSGT